MRSLSIIAFLFYLTSFFAFSQVSIKTQNEDWPLITKVDSVVISVINDTATSVDGKEAALRNYLQPFCDAHDAFACFLLATTYDKFAYGQGTAAEASKAKKYYHAAAEGNLAQACYFLYQMYRYNFMHVANDPAESMRWLQKARRFGNKDIQAQTLRELAGIYYPGSEKNTASDLKGFKTNIDSTVFYLQQALRLDTTDMWTLDFLGGIYEDKKNYEQSLYYYSRSRNEQSQLKIALWMASGKHVPRNTKKAIAITQTVLQKLINEDAYTKETIYNYMGVLNPVVMLNIFYKCHHILSRQELGSWYSGAISCDDFHYE